MTYEIKRGNATIATLTPQGKQQRKAMGEDVVDMDFTLAEFIDFKIGDWCQVYGHRYNLNQLPAVEKLSNFEFKYRLQLEAEWYDLAKVQYQYPNAKNQLLEPVFDLNASAQTFINLLVQNANRHSPGWQVGQVDATDYRDINFTTQNCLQVLSTLASTFNTEFWIENKTIHLQRREQASGLMFEYGQGNGLYNITRQNKTNANIFTRLYVRGGSQNLPTGYPANSLLLPNNAPYIEDPAKVALYGLIEHSIVFGDIFPQREGAVTGIEADKRVFFDNDIDFDVNLQKANGLDPKVHFNTGLLAGRSFTFAFDFATKKYTLNRLDEEKELVMPGPDHYPVPGDKYVLLDIVMPASYVTEAQTKLQAEAQNYYDKNSDPKFLLSYSANIDTIFAKQNGIDLALGNTAVLVDADMGINTELRIAGYERDLQEADSYTNVEWADVIGANEITRQYLQQQKTLKMLESSGMLEPAQLRRALFLSQIGEQNGYLTLAGQKLMVGFADDADKWDGNQFSDYLDQAIRQQDNPTFNGLTAIDHIAIPQSAPTSPQAGKSYLYADGVATGGGTPPAGASLLSQMMDVGIASPTNGQILQYNATTGKWENKNYVQGATTWAEIIGRPTALSAFANDLGNYGNWITKAQGDGFYKPLNWQPDLSGYATISSLDNHYTKTQADGRFKPIGWQPDLSGLATVNGNNASGALADAINSRHGHANKAFLDGLTAGATVNLNISGSASSWGNIVQSNAGISAPTYFITTDGSGNVAGITSAPSARVGLGLPQDVNRLHRALDWTSAGADANTVGENTSSFTYANNAPFNGYLGHFGSSYGLELNANYYGGSGLAFRTHNGDNYVWNGWNEIYHTGNIAKIRTDVLNDDLQSITNRGASTTNSIRAFGFINYNGAMGWSNYVHADGSNRFYGGFSGAEGDVLTITANGHVGIGTTNPTERLTVNGTLGVALGITTGDLTARGTITVESYIIGRASMYIANNITADGSISAGSATVDSGGAYTGMPIIANGINPGVGFHYPGQFGASLYMGANGELNWNGPRFNFHGTTKFANIDGFWNDRWYRSNGNVGWFNETHGGGIWMEDSSWVKVYNNKSFLVNGTAKATTLEATGAVIIPQSAPTSPEAGKAYLYMQ